MYASAPLGMGLQNNDRLQHGKRRWIGSRVGATSLAENVIYFGECFQDAIGDLQQSLRLGDRNAGQVVGM